eukprot:2677992-Pleurochrysis_carterae.AAC.1
MCQRKRRRALRLWQARRRPELPRLDRMWGPRDCSVKSVERSGTQGDAGTQTRCDLRQFLSCTARAPPLGQ